VVTAAESNGASGQTAAQAFLGPVEATLTEEVDRAWRQSVSGPWRERHLEAQQMKARLEELDDRAQREELPLDDARQRADLSAEFRTPEDALPLFRDLLRRAPDDAAAHFALGQTLLGRGEDEGLGHLDRAMELEPESLFPACERAFFYLKERGRDEEAEAYRARAERRYDTLELAQEERARPSTRGSFEPPTLPAEEIDRLRSQLASHKKLRRAYLVRKRMRHLDDEHPLHVLFVFPKSGLIRDLQSFVDEISANVEFDGWILSPPAMSIKRWTLRRIPGAQIY
jgi:hypothetical protein